MKNRISNQSLLSNLGIIYIEVTNKCNLACKYCYAIQRYQKANRMTIELFKQIVDFVAQYSKQNKISIIFHGGEPLLASPIFFKDCIKYANYRFQEGGKIVDYGIQSNLVLINDEIIDILQSNKVEVSTSIDGPSEVHNKARADWEKTKNNFIKLKESGIKVNFISVCSQHNKNHVEELYQMAKELNTSSLQLNIASSTQLIDPKSPYPPLSASDILNVFKDCIRCSIKYGIVERKLKLMIKHFLSPTNERLKQLYCDSPFCHAGINMLVFTPDGKIYACSPAVPLSFSIGDYSLGVIDKEIKVAHFEKTLIKFHSKGNKYSTQCVKCEASKICDFGCPAFDRIDPITAENHCLATQSLFDIFKKMPQEELELCIQ